MEKLQAHYHKLEFRPSKDFEAAPERLNEICKYIGFAYREYENKSQSTSKQFRTTETYRRLIDLHFTNSRKYGKCLDRIEIHGEAFEILPLDIGRILTGMEEKGFIGTEVHSRILIPQSIVVWDTIMEYCLADAYTATCKMVSPITDPKNDYSRTWQFGKRPHRRSAHSEGKRLVLYDCHKMHPRVPANTVEMELQVYGDTAHKFIFDSKVRDIDLTVRTLGVIRSFVDFKTMIGDSNRSRRCSAEFWQKIVSDFSAIHLPRMGKPAPKLENRVAKLQQILFAKQQQLGSELLLKAVATYVIDHDLTLPLYEILKGDIEIAKF